MPTRPLLKRLAASPLAGAAASASIAAYIRLVEKTTRWDYVGREHVEPLIGQGRGVIFAFWHQRLLMAAMLRRKTETPVFMLISAHRDGEIIANAVRPFGVEFIRGSAANPRKTDKAKGGAPAIAEMLGVLERGAIVGVTPDGPRGPRGRAQPGVIRLAQLSGAPIVPFAWSTSRGRFLNSWDRFFFAEPFSKGCFVATAPIPAPVSADPSAIEAARAALQAGLTEAARIADAAVGRSPDAAGLE